MIPEETVPCDAPQYWPLELPSSRVPVLVHYREPGELDTALQVLTHIEQAWLAEMDDLGFRRPLSDEGACGPDGDFDVFIWRGLEVAYVESTTDAPRTPWDDWHSFMAIDPWGPFGATILESTVAHELNHACQASDDWNDIPIAYEMTSTFIEDVVVDDDDEYKDLLVDFQSRPSWSLDRNDDYETWYMYGAALYLLYVRDRFFGGDPHFIADVWLSSRSPAGANEPDFEDGLDEVLAPVGSSYLESVVEFAKWRYYVASHDDGAHFEEGGTFPAEAEVAVEHAVSVSDLPASIDVEVMALGSSYVQLPSGGGPITLALEASDPSVSWAVQVIPGLEPGADGTVVDLAAGPVVVPGDGRVVVVTALPIAPNDDPDQRTDELFTMTLSISG